MASAPSQQPPQSSIRDIFDTNGLSIISYLESHRGICDIEFIDRPGVSSQEIDAWEAMNSPYKIPEDMKSFFLISDGLQFRWKILLNGKPSPLGNMNIKKLRDMKAIPLMCANPTVAGGLGEDNNPTDTGAVTFRAFTLDSSPAAGHTVLLYKVGPGYKVEEYFPQVWFQDLSGKWHFIAESFTDYFRLLIVHLGIPSWQYVFTDVGQPSACQQWFRLLSPGRLAINMEARARLKLEPC